MLRVSVHRVVKTDVSNHGGTSNTILMQLQNDEFHSWYLSAYSTHTHTHTHIHTHTYIYIGFKTFFYVVRHLDSIASYLPTGLHLVFFHSWPSLYLPSSFPFSLPRALFCFGIHFNAILGNLPSAIL